MHFFFPVSKNLSVGRTKDINTGQIFKKLNACIASYIFVSDSAGRNNKGLKILPCLKVQHRERKSVTV